MLQDTNTPMHADCNNTKGLLARSLAFALTLALFTTFGAASAFAQKVGGATSTINLTRTALIETDTTDYPPGSTVYLSAQGFFPGEPVTVQITHVDTTMTGGDGHEPWTETADENGRFTSSWVVPWDDNAGELLLVTADGQISGLHAQTTFTDANTILRLSGFAADTVVCPGGPNGTGDSLTLCATLTEFCGKGSEAALEGRPILFFLNPGNCGVDVGQVGDTVFTDAAGEACYTFAIPYEQGGYSVRVKFLGEGKPNPCPNPGNSACTPIDGNPNKQCIHLAASNDCRQFRVDERACYTPPPLVCPGDTTIALCAPEEICLWPFHGVSPDSGALSVSFGELRGDTVCFTPDTAGIYTIALRRTDSFITDSCVTNVTVTFNEPPQIVPANVSRDLCFPGETIFHQVTGFDTDLEPLTWSLASGYGSIDQDGVISFAPDTSGVYCFDVNLADDCDTAVATICVTVTLNQPPEMYEFVDTMRICGDDTICFVAAGFDRDFGDTVEIKQVGGPGSFVMNTDTSGVTCFSTKDVTTVTTFKFIYEITDQCTRDVKDLPQWVIEITVIPGAPPIVKLPKNFEYPRCEPGKVCVTAEISDPNGDLAAIETNLGVYDAQTGEICFNSGAGDADTLIVTATDSCGFSDVDTTIITYVEPAPLTITCPPDTSVFLCDSGQVCVPFGQLHPDWTLTVKPASVTYDAASGDLCFDADATLDKQITTILTNGCDTDTCVFTVSVELNAAPVVTAAASLDTLLCEPAELCWAVSVTDANDNLASVEVTAPAVYDAANNRVCLNVTQSGQYSIEVRATDECGAVDVDTIAVDVTLNSAPEVTAGSDMALDLCGPEQVCVSFNIGDADQTVLDVVTSVGEYNPNSNVVCFTPDTAGVYTVVATATDSCGAEASDTALITIRFNEAPVIDLGADTTISLCDASEICLPVNLPEVYGNSNLEAVFTSIGIYNPTTKTICFTPSGAGDYQIVATARDICGLEAVDTLNVTVEIGAPPNIACPVEPIAITVCGEDSISYEISVLPPDAQVTVIGGVYNNGSIKIAVDTSGVYNATIIAATACGADTCDVSFIVTVGEPVKLKCPSDTTVFICEAGGKISIPVGLAAQSAEVVVSPIGAYANGYVSFNADTAGLYVLDIIATTDCGADSCHVNVTVDINVPPVVIGPNDTTIFVCDRTKLYFPFEVSDPDGNLMSIMSSTGHIVNDSVCIDAGPGEYTIILTATDSCGASAADTSVITVLGNTPPVVTLPDDLALSLCVDEELCFPVDVSDADGNLVSVSADGGTLKNNDTEVCVTTNGGGVYTVIVSATDECGATGADTLVITADVNLPPRVKLAKLDDRAVCDPKKTCLSLTITDENLDTVIVEGAEWDEANSRVCFTPDTSGLYTIIVTAIDTCGIAVADTSSAYFWVNSPPKVSGPSDTTIAVCEAGTICFPVDVFDAEDNVTSIIATGGTNIYYNAGQVCFDPDSSGVYEIIVTATDSCDAMAADTTLVTVIENRPPSLELQDTLTIQCVDEEVCLPLNLSDPDDNIDTVIVTGGRYDESTGELCFTPAGNGEVVVVVVAVDDCGASVTDSLRVTVNNGDPFALDCPNDTAVFICEPDTLCFSVPGVPEGALVELSPPSVWYDAAQGTVCFYTNCSIRKDIRMIVTNGCYVDTCEFVVSVTMNSPPLVIAAPDTAALLCVPQDVCVPVGISDANENISHVVVAPDGYYNKITGRVCVPVDTSGIYHVIVTAYDSCGATGVDSFYVNARLNQPPVVTDGADTTIFLCAPAPVCLPISVSDPDRNLLSIGVQNGVYDPKSDMVCFIPDDTGGVYTIITTAIDACGAKDVDTTVATVIINSPPELTITSDTALFICEPGEVCIPVQLYDADGNIAVVTASAGAWWDEATQSICFAAGGTGSYEFETTVVDSCGAYTRKRTTVHVTVNTAPVVATSVDTTVVGCAFQEICIPVGISDAEDNLIIESVTVWPSGTYDPLTGLVCLTPQNTGMITLVVAATDDCGLTGADTTWINVELTDGPTIECPTIPINAFVCGADTICQSIAISPPDAQVSVSHGWFANGELCFVADTAGVYQIEMIATAACGADTCVITFNVAQGQKPEFSCPPDTQLLLCEPGAICIPVGALPQGAEVIVTPSGTYNAGQVCFQADTAGRYDITVIAQTTCGGDTCSFSVDVNFNTPPEITPIGIQGPGSDTLISVCDPGAQEVCLEFTLTDVDSNIIEITVPPFATYDWVDSTVTICFTPDTSGSYDLWLQAADECDTATFDTVFVIIDADSTPTIICLDTVTTEFCEPGLVCYPIDFAPVSAELSSPDAQINGDSVCLFLDTTGVYTATILATNDCGVDTCLLAVEATRLDAPQVTCPDDTVLFSCVPDTVCLPFTFAPQSAFVSVNAPAFVNVETSEICIPITKDTTFTVTVSAQISCGVAECSFTVTTELNEDPQVTLPDDFAEFQCVFDSICIPVTIVDDELNVESIEVNFGVYDPARGVVCFLPPTIGAYQIIVSATDSCGADDADTVVVSVATGVAAEIVCPQGLQSASLCAPGEVCLLVPVNAGVDSVITNIGAYNPVSKKLCFFADTSGLYEITMVAWAPCGVDTCEFVVDVEITPTPTLSCPGPIDTLLCVSQTDSLCVNIGMVAAGSTVEVKPVGAYADGYVCFPVDTPGVYTIDVLASTICGSDSCRLTVTIDDNNAPDLNVPTTLSIPRCPEDTDFVCISGIFASDAEGDPLTLTKICGPGELNITGEGTADLCFLPVAVDTTYEFCIQASDGCHTRTESFFVTVYPANDCGVCLTVSIDGPECTPVNREVSVYINVDAQDQIGGYDLLISYDPSALAFLTANIGAAIEDWEYFTYRQGPFGSCTGGCPSGMLRLVAIADINDGANHPPSDALLPQGALAEIRFRIVNNQNLGKIFVPVNFFWLDCGDNAFSDPTGQFLYVDQRIFNFEGGLVWDENDDSRYPESSRPFGLGAPDECLIGDKYQPIRCVDFINGGVCIIDPEKIDARGDLNLNALAYEVADAVVYTNYFIVGLSAFIFSIDGQTAASDVNADGATLTIADLVYLIRVIIGDAAPIPKNIPGVVGANVQLQRHGDSFTITADADVDLGAAHLVFEYDGVAPESITLGDGAAGMDLAYHIENGLIRALVYEDVSHATGRVIPAGVSELIQVNMPSEAAGAVRLVGAELTDGMGWRVINANVTTSTLPEKFELTQNYPNPFNPETIIEMALPSKSEWTLTIYNMLGQRVRRFDGLAEAGVVRIRWDGRDSDGSRVASGVYLYQAKAGSSVATKKMMLLK